MPARPEQSRTNRARQVVLRPASVTYAMRVGSAMSTRRTTASVNRTPDLAADAPAGPPPITNTSTINEVSWTLRPHVPGVNVLGGIGNAGREKRVMALAAFTAQAAMRKRGTTPFRIHARQCDREIDAERDA